MVAIIIAQIIFTRYRRRVLDRKRTAFLAKYLPSGQTDNLTQRQIKQTGKTCISAI